MPRIFISYRRSDSITISGRIYDRLAAAYGEGNVFKDVDDIPFGADFRAVLEREVSTCDVLLTIIGATWASAADDRGVMRLNNPDDFVRIEIESGLNRTNNVLVIPVLVSGAKMPTPDQLPSTLSQLPFRNAAVVRDDPDFSRDMARLIEQINRQFAPETLTIAQARSDRPRLPVRPRLDFPEIRSQISSRGVIFAGMILVMIALFALIVPRLFPAPNITPTTEVLPTAIPTAEITSEPTSVPVAAAPEFWLSYPVAQNIFSISDAFDEPRPSYGQIAPDKLPLNEGVNIVAEDAQGNPSIILATQRGVVERVNTDTRHPFGYFVTIRHTWYGEEWVTWYAHLGRIDVQEGQFVASGAPIGIIGNTGNSMGNNLKLIVQHIGEGLPNYLIDDVVNPEPLFTVNPPSYDEAWLLEEVSIPNGTRLEVGATFTKTWRVTNTGTRTWDRNYGLRRVEGDAFGLDSDETPVLQSVVFLRPGDVTDISLDLQAPDSIGTYDAVWQLTNNASVRFEMPIRLEIIVVETMTLPTLTPTEDRGYDLSRYVADVTIPDGTVFAPRAEFTKTWRIRNGGTTTWDVGYALVFVDGDRMSGAVSIDLPHTEPGATITMSVDLIAPNRTGTFRGYWQARNPEGDLFGSPLYVEIRVE